MGDVETMTKTDASTNPKVRGSYVCWLLGARFPVVLVWNGVDGYWRRGLTRVHVTHYLGPLPE